MTEIWFEEELVAADAAVEQTVQTITEVSKSNAADTDRRVRNAARGILRVEKPRWEKLDAATYKPLTSGEASQFYLVRLGFEFDIPPEVRDEGARFIYARCYAYLWPGDDGQPQPTVYDLIPRDLYEGEPRKVSLKLGPQIKLDTAEVSLAEVSTDFMVGVVEPVIVGWFGKDERAPYWELRPQSKTLLGIRHLWLIIEAPAGCNSVQLATMAEGDIQTHFGPIPIGPKIRSWEGRNIVIIK